MVLRKYHCSNHDILCMESVDYHVDDNWYEYRENRNLKIKYNCTKINVAENIQDDFYEYYAEKIKEEQPTLSENDIKTGITMLLVMSGPKVDNALKANEVEVFDGFICSWNNTKLMLQ